MTIIAWPTAREVAVAVVVAARLHDEDPVLTVEGEPGMRGRWHAFIALLDAFPSIYSPTVARWVGFAPATALQAKYQISSLKKHKTWWTEADQKAVKAALRAAIAATDGSIGAPAPIVQRHENIADRSAVTPPPAAEFEPGAETEDAPTDAPTPDATEQRAFERSIEEHEAREARASRKAEPAKITPSPAAHALADYTRSRPAIIKVGRGHVVDRRREGVVDMGDPPPGRSALDQAREGGL